MAKRKKKVSKTNSSGANVGYEAQLWEMADALRGSMDAAEYKHVVLGLIFLKYISDAFEEQHAKLVAEQASGADPEDPDEYRALSIFWVPPEARWAHLKAQAKQSTIGKLVDDAMAGIERDNPVLKGVLPKDYARPALDKTRLGQLIDLISNIQVGDEARTDPASLTPLRWTDPASDPASGTDPASGRPRFGTPLRLTPLRSRKRPPVALDQTRVQERMQIGMDPLYVSTGPPDNLAQSQ